MSETNLRLPLATATNLANRIIASLEDCCEPDHCVVAGSVRRQEPDVGDIELVVIPKQQPAMFPGIPGDSLLAPRLAMLASEGRLIPAYRDKMPEKLIRFYIPHLYNQGINTKLEINVSSPERWPVELAIKTGPEDFSHRLVMTRPAGFLPQGYYIKGGNWQVCKNGGFVPFETEREFIEFCFGRWIAPGDRGGNLY